MSNLQDTKNSQLEQEPDKYMMDIECTKCGTKQSGILTVNTTPPQRKPLTHEQRFDLLTKFEPHKNKWEAPAILIDMVEAAHGIKEKNT